MGFYWLHWIIAGLSLAFAVIAFLGRHKWTAVFGVVLAAVNMVLSFIFKF